VVLGQQGQGQKAGQSSVQWQSGGQGTQLADQDIMQVALNETKHMAEAVNTYIMEATNEQLRRDYMTMLGDLYNQQKQIFDAMQQKGFYNVKNATPQDIAQAKNKFSGQAQQSFQ